MTDRHEKALRERVEAKHGPIAEQKVPTDPDKLAELAAADPDQFNALVEADRISASALGAKEADDGDDE